EHDVVLRDPADALVDDVDPDLRVLDFRELPDDRLDRPDDVALDDEVQLLHGTDLHLLEQPVERNARPSLRQLLAAEPIAAHVRELARAPLVLDDAAQLARGRRLVEAENLDRITGPCVLDLLPA